MTVEFGPATTDDCVGRGRGAGFHGVACLSLVGTARVASVRALVLLPGGNRLKRHRAGDGGVLAVLAFGVVDDLLAGVEDPGEGGLGGHVEVADGDGVNVLVAGPVAVPGGEADGSQGVDDLRDGVSAADADVEVGGAAA